MKLRNAHLVHTLREFMSKILRLESMLSGEHGGVIGEAIRACNRRLDSHRATMDDFYASRISTQDWYHDLSDQEGGEEVRLSNRDTNAENQPGVENRPSGRRRLRGHAPQRRFQSKGQCLDHHHHHQCMTPHQCNRKNGTFPPEMIQQAMHRLICGLQSMCD